MKTVLAPNAPWPEKDLPKPKYKKKYKSKAKPDEVDKNFERWLTTITPIKTKPPTKGKDHA